MSSGSLLTVCAAVAAAALAGFSDSRIAASDEPIAPAAKTADRPAVQPAKTAIGELLATAALNDRQLSEIRGGFSTGSGPVVNFSFQEATYVNHNLAQSVVVPTMTISPGSAAALAAPTILSSSIQSLLNNGMTSIASSVGHGGFTNAISNTANNQLVQQVITANIGIAGLSQAIQQNLTSTVASRLAAANSQFR